MNKVSGLRSDFAYMSEDESRVVIGYDLKETDSLCEWYEVYLYKKQNSQITLQMVKDAIITDINERVKNKIIGGFVWNEKPIWLSEENQMNFAQAVVPVTFKIGEEADGSPIYQEFTTKTDLKNFVEACVLWKQQCLNDGWAEKDGIDWSPYEALFPQTEQAKNE